MVLDAFLRELADIEPISAFGRVRAVHGALIEVAGPLSAMHVGVRVRIAQAHRTDLVAEVIGFRDQTALCLPFGVVEGLRAGAEAMIEPHSGRAFPSKGWLGRVVDAMGEPADGKGALPQGLSGYLLRASPPRASERRPVGGPIDLGVKALNTFVTCCRGQRMGIFAGSGVGKSVLLSMLARYTQSGVAVIGLIGERGREVQEFITENLGEEGLKRSVVVVATSDESALARRQAAYMTLTLAEYFRDQGEHVLCMIDSITRFAQAQREVGLAIGEPPTTRGYVPSVFTELPRLLERAGPGAAEGAITGLFTVLIEGDDHNEPIADAVRGILDGHVVMERGIAERGRYPAINVLKSVSRTMPGCVAAEHRPLLARAKQLLGTYADMEELIRLGAYRKGSSPDVDEAIAYQPRLEAFLSQAKDECVPLAQGYQQLAQVLDHQGRH